MKPLVKTVLACGAALGLLGAPSLSASPRLTGQERLEKMLEGRVAGKPQSCIFTPGNNNLTVLDKTALVYRSGGTIWVNRPADPHHLDDDDILVIRRFSGSELCRTDQITTADRSTGMFNGVIFLGDFVPYKKAA